MDLDKPAFVKRRMEDAGIGGVGEAADSKAIKLVAGAKAMADNKKEKGGGKGRGKGEDAVLQELVVMLGRLVLQNSLDIRELTAVSLMTFLVPSGPILEAGLGAGQQFQLLVKKSKEVKKSGATASSTIPEAEMEAIGSPHVMVAMATLPAIFLVELVYSADDIRKVKLWWDETIVKASEEEVGAEIPIFKVRKPQTPSKGKLNKKGKVVIPETYGKLIVAFKNQEVAEILHRGLVFAGSVRKTGPAPRGWLERQAQDLLSRYSK